MSLKEIITLSLFPGHFIPERIAILKIKHELSRSLIDILNICENKCNGIGVKNYSIYINSDSVSKVMENYSSILQAKLLQKVQFTWDYQSTLFQFIFITVKVFKTFVSIF